MDNYIKDFKIQECCQHNQPIFIYDQQNKPLCFSCLEQQGMKTLSQCQQQQKQMIQEIYQEFDKQKQQLQQSFDSIVCYKTKLIEGLDKITQYTMDEMRVCEQKKITFQQFVQSQFQENKFDANLLTQLTNEKKQNQQVRNQIALLLSNFQQQYFNNNERQVVKDDLNKSKNLIEITSSQEKRIKITEFNVELFIPKIIEYKLLPNSMKVQNICRAFAFNRENNILAVGSESIIILYKFLNGSIKEIQSLTKHSEPIYSLAFFKKTNSFVSGCWDSSMIIWILDKKNEWTMEQKLKDHKHCVGSILINTNEDLLISGSHDKSLKFWVKKNIIWSCQQTIQLDDTVFCTSINEKENRIITTGSLPKIKVIQKLNDNQWGLVQEINVEEIGYRLIFTFCDEFIFQPKTTDFLEQYDFDSEMKQFQKIQQVQIQNTSGCNILFPCQFIKFLNLLIVKHGQYLNLFKVKQKDKYELIQTIKYYDYSLYGTMTQDGEYLVSWDFQTKEIQIRKLNRN